MASSSDITIHQQQDQQRWEARIGESLAGFCAYDREPDRIVFTHTVVQPEFEGRGVGSALAERALDDARAQGLKVRPSCRFIAAYIERHPQYADLVD
ncbi:GNAT family N-acetyltransferase [Xylophilus sp. GOD-11R]|uniref:GNAT family N-acetyltransferase n=1 Tax=Xylophilus sp. GOD-11R TaxID=3089814 RepID=UPI00298C5CEB|nr:GNAT family N-acetyltransferase [Xylophilus sp. GOD-11R]WPB57412.1 GNAT family N-acetyltransferase [Xylophilus sp. GOD-11R]